MADGDTLNVYSTVWLLLAGLVVVIILTYPLLTRKRAKAAVVKLVGAGAIPDEQWNMVKRAIVCIENYHTE